MKKIISLVLAFLLLTAAFPLQIFAAWSAAPSLSLVTAYDSEKQQVTATVSVTDYADLAALQFDLLFDNAKLSLNGKPTVSTELTNAPPDTSSVVPGKIIFLWMDNDAGTTGGVSGKAHTVMTAVFDVVSGQNGATDLSVSNFVFVDKNGEEELTNKIGTTTRTENLITKITSQVALSGALSTPVKKALDNSSLSGANVTTSIVWSPALISNTFAGDTVYTATVTASPASNYVFAANAAISYPGLDFVKSGNTFVAKKTFDKTDKKNMTGISVITAPNVKAYKDGDTLNTAGLTVKASYDDNSVDNNFKAYDIKYQNGNSFKKGDTKVTVSVGSLKEDITGLIVSGKTASASLFTYTNPALTYNATNQLPKIMAALSAGGSTTTRGNIIYKFTKDASAVTEIINAGEYKILADITGGTEYDAANDVLIASIKVLPKSIEESEFNIDLKDKSYSATQIKPAVATALQPSDYQVSYGENINAADNGGTITIKGKNNLSGTITKTFTIKPITLTANDIEYKGAAITKVYDGTSICSLSEVSVKAGVLKGSDTLKVNGKAQYISKDVTANKIIFTPTAITTGNYRLAASQIIEIAAVITPLTTITDETNVGTAAMPTNVVKGEGSFSEVKIKGAANEAATGKIEYLYDGASTYNDIKQKLALLSEDDVAQINYTFTGSANYLGAEKTGTIFVKIVDITFSVNGFPATDKNAVSIKANAVYGDKWNEIITIQNIQAKVGTNNDNNTGKYTLDQSGIPSAGKKQDFKVIYNGTINGKTFTNVVVCSGKIDVAPKTLTASDLEYKGSPITKEYDGTSAYGAITASVKKSSLIGNDTLFVAGQAVYNSADVAFANSVTFTADEINIGNYRVPSGLSAKFVASITKKNIAPFVEKIQSVDYDGKEKKPNVVVKNGMLILPQSNYIVNYSNNINAGTKALATITASEKGNYAFTDVKGIFTINKIVNPNNGPKAYSIMHGARNKSLNLSDLGIPSGCTFEEIKISDPNNIFSVPPTQNGYILNFSIKNDKALINKTAQIVIPVSNATNYLPFDIELNVQVKEKNTVKEFAFASEALTKLYTDSDFEFAIQKAPLGREIKYLSSDESIAKIGSDGKIKILRAGNTTISAVLEENEEFYKKTASFELIINKAQLIVKPCDESIFIGDKLPTFAVEYLGVKTGENAKDIAVLRNGQLSMQVMNGKGDGTLTNTDVGGNYKIVFDASPTFEKSDNYDIVVKDGNLEILSRPASGNESFVITASWGKGGYINTSDKVNVNIGESAGFSIIADKGYKIADVKVDGKSVGATKYYLFTKVTANHTISASFTKTNPQTNITNILIGNIAGIAILIVGITGSVYFKKKHNNACK